MPPWRRGEGPEISSKSLITSNGRTYSNNAASEWLRRIIPPRGTDRDGTVFPVFFGIFVMVEFLRYWLWSSVGHSLWEVAIPYRFKVPWFRQTRCRRIIPTRMRTNVLRAMTCFRYLRTSRIAISRPMNAKLNIINYLYVDRSRT